jgi:hypothetical protein
MFDLERDPHEMRNVYDDPEYAAVRAMMEAEYRRLREYYDAPDHSAHVPELR